MFEFALMSFSRCELMGKCTPGWGSSCPTTAVQKHVLFPMTLHLGLSVMFLLCITCGWEAWPRHTHRTHPCLRREGTKQCLLEYLNLALSAKHPRPEFEWTKPKESSVLNSAMLPIIHMISGPPAGQTRCPYNGNRWF